MFKDIQKAISANTGRSTANFAVSVYMGKKEHRIKLNPAQERGNQTFGANFTITQHLDDCVNNVAGGLLYPSPAANLVSEQREELAF